MSKKLSLDTKISADALHYEYAVGQGIDFRHRVIQLTDDIQHPMFDYLDAAMTQMERESRRGITIKINSFGGSVFEALAIVGRIKESNCLITTKGYGSIMSAATLILAAGDKRKISQFAWYMHHESSYSLDGRHSANKAEVIQIERMEEQWAMTMAEFSIKDIKFWKDTGKHIDAYFDASELIELGVADEIF